MPTVSSVSHLLYWLSCNRLPCPAGPELPALQQLGRLPLTVPEQAGSAAADGSGGLPAGWQVMHEPLQMWSLINPPFIAASCKANPLGLLHSGHMNM